MYMISFKLCFALVSIDSYLPLSMEKVWADILIIEIADLFQLLLNIISL